MAPRAARVSRQSPQADSSEDEYAGCFEGGEVASRATPEGVAPAPLSGRVVAAVQGTEVAALREHAQEWSELCRLDPREALLEALGAVLELAGLPGSLRRPDPDGDPKAFLQRLPERARLEGLDLRVWPLMPTARHGKQSLMNFERFWTFAITAQSASTLLEGGVVAKLSEWLLAMLCCGAVARLSGSLRHVSTAAALAIAEGLGSQHQALNRQRGTVKRQLEFAGGAWRGQKEQPQRSLREASMQVSDMHRAQTQLLEAIVPNRCRSTSFTTSTSTLAVAEARLPDGWKERTSGNSGRTFYHNAAARESQWVRPSEGVPLAPALAAAVGPVEQDAVPQKRKGGRDSGKGAAGKRARSDAAAAVADVPKPKEAPEAEEVFSEPRFSWDPSVPLWSTVGVGDWGNATGDGAADQPRGPRPSTSTVGDQRDFHVGMPNLRSIVDLQMLPEQLCRAVSYLHGLRPRSIVTDEVASMQSTLLPAQRREHFGRPTLALDLDETLVHCTTAPLPGCPPPSLELDIAIMPGQPPLEAKVYVRPYARLFLEVCSHVFETVVFTASCAIYADDVLDFLDPDGRLIAHRLYRESCTYLDGSYFKDMRRMGRRLEDVVLVDNTVLACALTPDNGIVVSSWYGDDYADKELMDLLGVLQKCACADSMPQFLTARYGFAEFLEARPQPTSSVAPAAPPTTAGPVASLARERSPR